MQSLPETVMALKQECVEMKRSLHTAQVELARLRHLQPLPPVDLRRLQRRIARHCHPDAGGSDQLMVQINTLFDFLGGKP